MSYLFYYGQSYQPSFVLLNDQSSSAKLEIPDYDLLEINFPKS